MIPIILAFMVGMWAAAVISYFLVVKPMIWENKKLRETIHQQVKIGFYEELKQDEYE